MNTKKRILEAYGQKDWSLIRELINVDEIKYPTIPDFETLSIVLINLTKNINQKYSPDKSNLPLLNDIGKKDFLKRAKDWRIKYKKQRLQNKDCLAIVQIGVFEDFSSGSFKKSLGDREPKDIINELIFRGGDFGYDCYDYKKLIEETGMSDTEYIKKIYPYLEQNEKYFKSYKNYEFHSTNNYLRYHKNPKAELNEIIDGLPPLSKDIYVFRWVILNDKTQNSYLVKNSYRLLGYVSTSLVLYNERVCKDENDSVSEKETKKRTLIRIKIPKGKKVWFFLDDAFESEVLLNMEKVILQTGTLLILEWYVCHMAIFFIPNL